MDISRDTLNNLYTGFKKNFQTGFDSVKPTWARIATRVPSSTAQNSYPWLGDMPGLREWIGDRQIKKFGLHDYTIKNRKFEQTVSVKVDAIEDDQFGIYAPLFTALGDSAARWPDETVWPILREGFEKTCYDGQGFFDTDHPVYGENGKVSGTIANCQTGSHAPWFLLNTKMALKPLIWQERESPNKLVRLDREQDQNVFMRDEYVYGSKARGEAGFGFWQMAFGAQTELNEVNFKAARLAMRSITNEFGKPLANEPDLLVVGVGNADQAEDLIKAEKTASGATNMLRNAVEVLVTPYVY